jgi:stage II sporulation protein GA (sporulation sigma-E factor processing peptidase)
MIVVVYLDILLIQNCVVNTFLLIVTAQCLRVRINYRRIITAAIIGSLYVLCMLWRETYFLVNIPLQLVVAFLMISIGIKSREIFFKVKGTCFFILLSMLLSGICVYLNFNSFRSINLIGVIIDFSHREMLLAAIIVYIVLHRMVVYIKDRRDITLYTYTVDIITGSKITTVKAFLDTGNELREPVTNLPVMIVQRNAFDKLELKESEKLYIPYRVINGHLGKLEGFKPNFISIYYGQQKIEARDVIIGFSEQNLSEHNDYEALLSRGII